MVGPFITRVADTQAGGAATQSARREAARDGHTRVAPAASSSQTDEDAARADPVRLRPGPAVPVELAHAPCPGSPALRRWCGLRQACGSLGSFGSFLALVAVRLT